MLPFLNWMLDDMGALDYSDANLLKMLDSEQYVFDSHKNSHICVNGSITSDNTSRYSFGSDNSDKTWAPSRYDKTILGNGHAAIDSDSILGNSLDSDMHSPRSDTTLPSWSPRHESVMNQTPLHVMQLFADFDQPHAKCLELGICKGFI